MITGTIKIYLRRDPVYSLTEIMGEIRKIEGVEDVVISSGDDRKLIADVVGEDRFDIMVRISKAIQNHDDVLYAPALIPRREHQGSLSF